MALTGNEFVRIVGVIGGGPAATARYVTTQNIANLDNGGTTTLSATDVLQCYGASGSGIPSAVPFNIHVSDITALGSIAPSTLAGTELLNVIPAVVGGAPSAVTKQATTQSLANA